MLIRFKAPDPRAGTTARMDSSRGQHFVDIGTADLVDERAASAAPLLPSAPAQPTAPVKPTRTRKPAVLKDTQAPTVPPVSEPNDAANPQTPSSPAEVPVAPAMPAAKPKLPTEPLPEATADVPADVQPVDTSPTDLAA